MSTSGPKKRISILLDADTKAQLKKIVPRGRRSRFVEKAIDKALRNRSADRTKDGVAQF